MDLNKLREKRGNVVAQARSILDAAPDGNLSAEDQTRFDALMKESDDLKAQIERGEKIEKEERELGESQVPPTQPDPSPASAARSGNPRATEEYRKAFAGYLRTGHVRAPLQTVEARATVDGLQADIDTAGGYTYPDEQFLNQLIRKVDDAVVIRGLATKQRVTNADSLGVPSLDADPEDGDWTQELVTVDFDTQMEFGKREMRPHELTKGIKISRKLINRSSLGVENLVTERLAYKFSVTQERAFMTGNGANKPLGLFVASSDGISTSADVTATNTTSFVADDLVNTLYSLKAQYQARGSWLMHRDAVKMTRKMKDGNGQYMWAPGLTAGQPDTILNRPLIQSEFAPNTFTTGLYVAMFGDFSFYWIADAEDMSVQRLVELYANTNQVGFIGRMATDGMPVLEEAFARLKLA